MGSRVSHMRRTQPATEVLRDRFAAASRLADLHAAALAEASARILADPGNWVARQELETAEQLHYLALYEQRCARRALRRREALDAFIARLAFVPWAARTRRR
jgi:hypothetical protein